MEILIDLSKNGKRLDKVLVKEFTNLSRSQIEHLIKKEGVIINTQKILKPSYKLKGGEMVLINWDLEPKTLQPNPEIKLNILFENDDFMVINKQPNLSVHPLRVIDMNTLVNGLLSYYPEIRDVGEDLMRPGIVHRLDKDTSGVMLVAKNNDSFMELKEMFKKHSIQKTYVTLVYGKMKNMEGEIRAPIAKSEQKFNRRKVSFQNPNKSLMAITNYKVLKEFKETSLLEVLPLTGRTHQIRVHLASLSNFVIGDKEYGSSKINKDFPIEGQFLHAKKLEFVWKGQNMTFEADLPENLQKCLNYVSL